MTSSTCTGGASGAASRIACSQTRIAALLVVRGVAHQPELQPGRRRSRRVSEARALAPKLDGERGDGCTNPDFDRLRMQAMEKESTLGDPRIGDERGGHHAPRLALRRDDVESPRQAGFMQIEDGGEERARRLGGLALRVAELLHQKLDSGASERRIRSFRLRAGRWLVGRGRRGSRGVRVGGAEHRRVPHLDDACRRRGRGGHQAGQCRVEAPHQSGR